MGGNRDDVVHREVAHDAGLNLNLLGIGFPFHLIAGLQFLPGHDAEVFEHLHAALIKITLEDDGTALFYVEAALGGFLNPLVAVAVAVEADGLAGLDILTQDIDDGGSLVFACGNLSVNALLEVGQCFGYSCVQGGHG